MGAAQKTISEKAISAILEDRTIFNVAVNDIKISTEELKSAIKRIYDIAHTAQYTN